jgi:hypothetical protein
MVMNVNDLPRRLAALLAATLLALSGATAAGCSTDDAAKKDAKNAAEDADKAAGNKDEKAASDAEDAGRDAADEIDDNDSK